MCFILHDNHTGRALYDNLSTWHEETNCVNYLQAHNSSKRAQFFLALNLKPFIQNNFQSEHYTSHSPAGNLPECVTCGQNSRKCNACIIVTSYKWPILHSQDQTSHDGSSTSLWPITKLAMMWTTYHPEVKIKIKACKWWYYSKILPSSHKEFCLLYFSPVKYHQEAAVHLDVHKVFHKGSPSHVPGSWVSVIITKYIIKKNILRTQLLMDKYHVYQKCK